MTHFLSRFKPRRAEVDLESITTHLALDLTAESDDETVLPFMAPPKGAQPYHGFRVMKGVTHDGFTFGAITDFVKRPGLVTGDGFIVAPDGSRAGLEWRLSTECYLLEMAPFTETRWGVWMVGIRHPMIDQASACRNLVETVPLFKEKWMAWREGSWLTDPNHGRPVPHPHHH